MVNETFMRGIQMTDVNGQVQFHTIYPGWYAGRISHIHVQVFVNSMLRATSQCAFPDSLNTEVYNTPLYSSKGQNTSVANNAADGVFAGSPADLEHELLTVVANASTGGYNGSLVIGINGSAAGVYDSEPETGGQFTLMQNYPNPFVASTSFAFTLTQTSHVELSVYDLNGQMVATLWNDRLSGGVQSVAWNREVDGVPVPAGNYVFQLSVTNAAGTFRQSKVMTVR